MRKSTGGGDGAVTTTDETPATIETPTEVTDAAASEGEQHFDPKHEWPATGGSYVRQTDGTLTPED